MWKLVGRLLKQAQQAGAVRRDVQLCHVQALARAACTAIDRQADGERLERIVWTVISDGLRPKESKHGAV
jgi:hypothetical protein